MQLYDPVQSCNPVISCLLAAGVRFLIVGSWAVRFHGYADRKVRDLDLLVEFSGENWPMVIRALQDLGITVTPFDELSKRPKPFKNNELHPVDLLTAIGSAFSESKSSCALLPDSSRRLAVASLLNGVTFDEAWSDSIETSFDEKGLRVRVLSKAHVILSKEHNNRPRDAEDIKKLLEGEYMDELNDARRKFWESTYLALLAIRTSAPEYKGGTIEELASLADRHVAAWDTRWNMPKA